VPASPRPARLDAATVVAWGLLAVATLVALRLWQGDGYWEYSDGVYALTARLVLDGQGLYADVAAAQPPPLFLAGAAILALGDDVGTLRAGVAVVQLVTSGLVLVAVWRLTRLRAVAVGAALLALLTPWAVREHAQLLPETFAAPLLLGAALAASRPRGALLAGALAALAVAFKLAFALPALAILLAARARSRALAAGLVAGVALAVAFLVAYGDPLLDGAVRAQRETGLAGVGDVAGQWAQAAWNLLPLLLCAALAWPLRARLRDRELAVTIAAAALGSLLLLATLFKQGSSLTVLVAVEPPLLCLAAAGVAAAWQAGRRTPVAIAGVAGALALVQVGSLLASPSDPDAFVRPLAASGPARALSPDEVDAAVAAIRRCPAAHAYGGPPYLAFAAGRRIAGDQPDQFILQHAPLLQRFRDAVAADPPRCP
jgi:hypothetical protein